MNNKTISKISATLKESDKLKALASELLKESKELVLNLNYVNSKHIALDLYHGVIEFQRTNSKTPVFEGFKRDDLTEEFLNHLFLSVKKEDVEKYIIEINLCFSNSFIYTTVINRDSGLLNTFVLARVSRKTRALKEVIFH